MKLKRMMMTSAMVVTLWGAGFVTAFADVAVRDVVAKQRYPWNGLVDITCKVTGIDGETNGLKLAVAAVMPDTSNARNVSHFWVVQGGTNSVDREVHTNGNYRLLWDARADLGIVRYTNMVVRISFDAHEKVQLWEGGPYWATTNIGAEKPEDYGYYFWWGDTVGYKRENDAWVATDGSSSNFSFNEANTATYGKEISALQSEGWIVSQDGINVLAPEHDAAQVQWGGGWRMPTLKELQDLSENCDWTWKIQNGVKGYELRGKGDYASFRIFLPVAGYGNGTLLSFGSYGYYWSSVPILNNRYRSVSLYVDPNNHSSYGSGSLRYYGMSVRPVQGFNNYEIVTPIAFDSDSVPFLLDTMDGVRIAQEIETITYSPLWNGAASCSVSVNGKQLLSSAEEGTTTWSRPESPGIYTLTHAAGDETHIAKFKVPVTLNVTDVTFRQRYPWNGLVDIDCAVNCSDPQTNISLYVSAKDSAANKSLAVRSVWLENDATHTNALAVKSGTHRLVWDAGRDNPNFVGDAVTVEVQALVGPGLYLVIDLSSGKDAASYPISYLGAKPQDGWADEYKTTKLVMRRIQPGTFIMGCETTEVGYYGYEAVPHEVTISHPFYIGVFEVTQKQYELVMGSRPSYFSNSSCYEARPVEKVSWNTIRGNSSTYNWPGSSEVDPSTFIGKIRAKTGIMTFDLPTEAVWEYACRAGTTTALNSGKNLTNGGSGVDPQMNEVGRYYYNFPSGSTSYSSSSDLTAGTAKVGSYLPNDWGLYDMHGNVWEWTLDRYQKRSSFTSAAVTDPAGPASGSGRVRRGGSWINGAGSCRSSRRDEYIPSYEDYINGFRLCCAAGQ